MLADSAYGNDNRALIDANQFQTATSDNGPFHRGKYSLYESIPLNRLDLSQLTPEQVDLFLKTFGYDSNNSESQRFRYGKTLYDLKSWSDPKNKTYINNLYKKINQQALNYMQDTDAKPSNTHQRTAQVPTSSTQQEFNRAFAAARRAGKGIFEFNGKTFTTQLAGENEENWNKHLQSKKTPVVPASNNTAASTVPPEVESVSTTQSNPVITDQNTDAQANQARYEWAKYMIDNPWAQPSEQDLADMNLTLLDYQKMMNTDSTQRRRQTQHQLNMQKSRERQKANNAAAKLAKQQLRQQTRNEIREVNQNARNERRDIRNRNKFGNNYNSPLDRE